MYMYTLTAPYRAIGYMLGSLLWPLIPWILNVILFGYWGASAIFLASMGDPEGASINETYVEQDQVEMFVDDATLNVPCEPGVRYSKSTQNIFRSNRTVIVTCSVQENTTSGRVCSFIKYGGDEYTLYLQAFQLFMLFWSANFVVALGQMTLAGAFASYYWAFNKPKDIPAMPVFNAFGRTVR